VSGTARIAVGFAFVLPFVLGLSARQASAACPNVCALTVEPPTLDVALTCVVARVTPATCDCGAQLVVINNCPDVVEAQDFLFDTCSLPNQSYQDFGHACAPVDPTGTGSVNLKVSPADGTGTRTWSLHLGEGGASHPLTVQANVSSFGAGGCACSATAARSPTAACLAIGVLAFRLRRRRGTPARRSASG
jgi:hypothetical protein